MTTTATDKSFTFAARERAIQWKRDTHALSEGARAEGMYGKGGPYRFCLPESFHCENLIPAARDIALDRFRAAGIPWHRGVSDGPSTHLLSSQVQCANALAPLVHQPDALAHLFGVVLPISRVLPFGAEGNEAFVSGHDLTDHVVFEWQGLNNHLNEWHGKPTRGSKATSADAAIRYVAHDGCVEMALIEWKYTESYPKGTLSTSSTSTATRIRRYGPLLHAADSPIKMHSLEVVDFFVEPVYQLMRLTLLAHAIERSGAQGVRRVRVLYVSPANNVALHASPCSEAYRRLFANESYQQSWKHLLRQPDRMVFMESSLLRQPGMPIDAEYVARYV